MTEIKIYYTITKDIDLSNEKIKSIISKERLIKTERYLKVDAKRNSFGAELILRYALLKSEMEGDPIIKYSERGKPFLCNTNIQFSLSHSGECVVCAVGEVPIGIDIERVRELKSSLCERIVGSDETGNPIFIWTAKEAFLKLCGEGLGGKYSLQDLRVFGDKVQCKKKCDDAYLTQWEIDDMAVSVCTYEKVSVKKEYVTLNEIMSALKMF